MPTAPRIRKSGTSKAAATSISSSGIAVVNTGHRHPKVIEAVKAQLDRFTHTCHQVVPYESYVRLAERLNGMLPGKFDKKTIFVTTGAEAVENAVKIARNATGRPAVIAFAGGFHGRTFMGMALTGKVVPYKVGFGAMPADVFHAPFPVALHGDHGRPIRWPRSTGCSRPMSIRPASPPSSSSRCRARAASTKRRATS